MAGAEMTIRLVDGTETEQAAFDRSPMEAASKADFAYDAKHSLQSVQQSLVALANQTASRKQPGEQAGATRDASGFEGITRDDVRDWRLAVTDLAEKFTPKYFAEPIERLIAALGGKSQAPESKTAPIPAVGMIPPRKEQNAMGDMFERLQRGLGNTRIGRGVNTAIQGAKNLAGKTRSVARSVGAAINKTKAGRAVTGMASRAASRVANSGFGKAVAGAGRAAGGAIARTVGTVAGSAAASGGTAGAAALANPVGIAVGAVVASFAGLALAAKGLNDTFTAEADRLEKYSAKIAIARGNQRINTELNMIDRAKKIDGPIGGLESSKAALNSSMERLWTEILILLSRWSPVLQKAVDIANVSVAKLTEMAAAQRESDAQKQVMVAKATKTTTDDAAAVKELWAAQIGLAEVTRKNQEAWERLTGVVAKANGSGRDPMLMSLLNAKVDP
jgi:hypothetical protein